MNIDLLNSINITDDDIFWVESIMGIKFDTSRIDIIKNLESQDIQAFPGSGKTTLLVAKLAILARKWPVSNSGICVLSHTNVAREEIEERLGNTVEGQRLLSYPHFVGTFHSFFDNYVSLPWIRARGIKINLIDTDKVKRARWKRLSRGTRFYFGKVHKDEQLCGYFKEIGNLDWKKGGKTRQELLEVIQQSQNSGNFTFDEMLLYSQQALEECKELSSALQNRFPLVFIDEAQDTNSFLWHLIDLAFPEINGITIRQGFGDSNQAIYNYVTEDAGHTEFPRKNPLIIKESKRFDNRIARLANTVALSKEGMIGTDNLFSKRDLPHTIFLFQKDKAKEVIDEFGKLVLESFTDEEIAQNRQKGCHIIGMVHKKKEETKENQFPKGIYDYWQDYDPGREKHNLKPEKLIDFLRVGAREFELSGEYFDQIKWTANGIRILLNIASGQILIPVGNSSLTTISKLIPETKRIDFRKNLKKLSSIDTSSMENWKQSENYINYILGVFNYGTNEEVKKYCSWSNTIECSEQESEKNKKFIENQYLFQNPESKRYVELQFGSIHSVKGRTHLATLILETYNKTHNIKAILKDLCNKPVKTKTTLIRDSRLKCQYVAMTRATALLCLAIPIDFVNTETQILLQEIGWNLKFIN